MKAKLLSYTIGATIVDEDDHGNVTARHVTEPVEVFGTAGLITHAASVEKLLADRTAELQAAVKPNRAQRRAGQKP